MACEGLQERLIEEAVAPGTDPALAEHLASCAGCRAELAGQRELQASIMGGLSAMVSGEPSPALIARVRMQIAAEPAAHRFGWMWLSAGVATAALAGFAIWFGARYFMQHAEPGHEQVRVIQKKAPQVAPQQIAQAPPSVPARPVRNPTVTIVKKHVREVTAPPVIHSVSTQGNGGQPVAVVIPPGQREAVLRLVAALRSGRVDVAGLVNQPPPQEITPLEIKPIKILTLAEERAAEKSGDIHK
jgi:hypothetical protein